ncbi:MAG: hypothetical protein ACI9CZ_000883, partial [Flavobacterium sp.]
FFFKNNFPLSKVTHFMNTALKEDDIKRHTTIKV